MTGSLSTEAWENEKSSIPCAYAYVFVSPAHTFFLRLCSCLCLCLCQCELALNRLLHCDKSRRAFENTKGSIRHEPQCSQMSGVFCHSNFVIWHSMRTVLLVLWLRILYLSPISNNFSWNPHHSYFLWYHFRSMDHFAGLYRHTVKHQIFPRFWVRCK